MVLDSVITRRIPKLGSWTYMVLQDTASRLLDLGENKAQNLRSSAVSTLQLHSTKLPRLGFGQHHETESSALISHSRHSLHITIILICQCARGQEVASLTIRIAGSALPSYQNTKTFHALWIPPPSWSHLPRGRIILPSCVARTRFWSVRQRLFDLFANLPPWSLRGSLQRSLQLGKPSSISAKFSLRGNLILTTRPRAGAVSTMRSPDVRPSLVSECVLPAHWLGLH